VRWLLEGGSNVLRVRVQDVVGIWQGGDGEELDVSVMTLPCCTEGRWTSILAITVLQNSTA